MNNSQPHCNSVLNKIYRYIGLSLAMLLLLISIAILFLLMFEKGPERVLQLFVMIIFGGSSVLVFYKRQSIGKFICRPVALLAILIKAIAKTALSLHKLV